MRRRRAGIVANARRRLRAGVARLFPDAPTAIEPALISMLFTSIGSVVVLGGSVFAIGLLLAVATGNVPVAALACSILVTTLARVALVTAYRRRGAVGDGIDVTRRWEMRYAAGSYLISGLIGIFNVRALTLQDPIVNMLVVGILFGYSAGLVTRLAVRPRICLISMALTAAPTS